MKENNITLQAINTARNNNRLQDESTRHISDVLANYGDGISRNIAQEISDTMRLAKIKALLHYVTDVLGPDSKYTIAIKRAMDDDDYARQCAQSTDTKSVEWYVGRCYNGNVSDVARVIRNVMGAQLQSVGKQIKRLANCIANSGMYDADDFVGAQLSVTRTNIATLYGKRYPILSDDKILQDVCTITYYLLHK
jgi:hypothetical protein